MPRKGTGRASRNHRLAGSLARLGAALASGILVLGGCVGGTTASGTTPGVAMPGASAPAITSGTTAPGTIMAPSAAPPGASLPGAATPSAAPPDPSPPRPSQTAPGGGGTGTTTPSPLPASAEPTPVSLIVTQADNNRTLHLSVGQRLLIDLGATLDWVVTVEDEGVVGRVPGVLVIRGAQGTYVARAPGTTLLNAVGSPICASGACPQFRVAFSVTLVVQ